MAQYKVLEDVTIDGIEYGATETVELDPAVAAPFIESNQIALEEEPAAAGDEEDKETVDEDEDEDLEDEDVI